MSNDRFDGQFSTAISTITAIDLKIRDIYIKSVLFNWYTNQKYRLGFGRRISEHSKIHTISALLMQVTSACVGYSATPALLLRLVEANINRFYSTFPKLYK